MDSYHDGLVDSGAWFRVFLRKDGSDRRLLFVEHGMEKPQDGSYENKAGSGRTTQCYDIDQGICRPVNVHPALLLACRYMGEISGYGVNAFHRDRKGLSDIRGYIKEYGELPRSRGLFAFLRRLFGG